MITHNFRSLPHPSSVRSGLSLSLPKQTEAQDNLQILKHLYRYSLLMYTFLFRIHEINVNIYITMHLHFDCQCLSTNSWTYFLDEAVIARALPRMMATEIC